MASEALSPHEEPIASVLESRAEREAGFLHGIKITTTLIGPFRYSVGALVDVGSWMNSRHSATVHMQ